MKTNIYKGINPNPVVNPSLVTGMNKFMTRKSTPVGDIMVLNRKFNINIHASDPTHTITIRKRWVADGTRRFKELARDIKVSVVDNDALGLNEVDHSLIQQAAAPSKVFAFRTDAAKIEGFMEWLRAQEQLNVLELVPSTDIITAATREPWANTYIRSSYQKGLADGRNRLVAAGMPVQPFGEVFGAGLVQAFNLPFHANRVALIYTRDFSELKGVTEAMNQQISRVLAEGLAEGVGTREMARRMVDRVDKIGITRSNLIARTETVRAFNMGALGEFEMAELTTGLKINVEWITALDERVRDSHLDRHGREFTKEEGQALIGEPNCRCALIPITASPEFQERKKEDVADRRKLKREREEER